jgi:hypothetical protein
VNLDKKAQEFIAVKPNLMVPWFLMASYLYYHENESMFSDEYYDALSKELLLKWDQVEHSHKHLIDVDDLMAGSMYRLKELDYPSMCRASALFLMKELKE